MTADLQTATAAIRGTAVDPEVQRQLAEAMAAESRAAEASRAEAREAKLQLEEAEGQIAALQERLERPGAGGHSIEDVEKMTGQIAALKQDLRATTLRMEKAEETAAVATEAREAEGRESARRLGISHKETEEAVKELNAVKRALEEAGKREQRALDEVKELRGRVESTLEAADAMSEYAEAVQADAEAVQDELEYLRARLGEAEGGRGEQLQRPRPPKPALPRPGPASPGPAAATKEVQVQLSPAQHAEAAPVPAADLTAATAAAARAKAEAFGAREEARIALQRVADLELKLGALQQGGGAEASPPSGDHLHAAHAAAVPAASLLAASSPAMRAELAEVQSLLAVKQVELSVARREAAEAQAQLRATQLELDDAHLRLRRQNEEVGR